MYIRFMGRSFGEGVSFVPCHICCGVCFWGFSMQIEKFTKMLSVFDETKGTNVTCLWGGCFQPSKNYLAEIVGIHFAKSPGHVHLDIFPLSESLVARHKQLVTDTHYFPQISPP